MSLDSYQGEVMLPGDFFAVSLVISTASLMICSCLIQNWRRGMSLVLILSSCVGGRGGWVVGRGVWVVGRVREGIYLRGR